MTVPVRDRTVGGFLDELAGRIPDPAAGAAAAVTVGAAASLVAMAARFTEGPLGELASRADRLRAEALVLADEDGEVYGRVLEAMRLPRDAAARQEKMRSALAAATEVPLRIAEAAAEIAEMAISLTDAGNPNLAGDAETAAILASGSTHAVHRMVETNVRLGDLDHDLVERADQFLDRARKALETRGQDP